MQEEKDQELQETVGEENNSETTDDSKKVKSDKSPEKIQEVAPTQDLSETIINKNPKEKSKEDSSESNQNGEKLMFHRKARVLYHQKRKPMMTKKPFWRRLMNQMPKMPRTKTIITGIIFPFWITMP